MTFDEYQKFAESTAIYPEKGANLFYPTLGLAGEAGEVSNKVKKIFRDEKNVVSDEMSEDLLDELGDVLWYTAQLATELHISLEDVARKNIEKLTSRQDRGTLHGTGDKR